MILPLEVSGNLSGHDLILSFQAGVHKTYLTNVLACFTKERFSNNSKKKMCLNMNV